MTPKFVKLSGFNIDCNAPEAYACVFDSTRPELAWLMYRFRMFVKSVNLLR